MQSILKIGSALAERVGQGEVGVYTALGDSAWQLAIEKALSALEGPFFCFLVQTSLENGPFTISFQSGGVFSGWRALTIECNYFTRSL